MDALFKRLSVLPTSVSFIHCFIHSFVSYGHAYCTVEMDVLIERPPSAVSVPSVVHKYTCLRISYSIIAQIWLAH